MARARVSVTVDDAALRELYAGQVADGTRRAAGRVRDRAKVEITTAGRVDTGQMRNATVAESVRVDGAQVRSRVITEVDYALIQHEGASDPIIRPRRARVLRWRPKRGGAFVFRPQVRSVHPANPTRPVPFLTNALERLRSGDFSP